jgi:hypothetical protein
MCVLPAIAAAQGQPDHLSLDEAVRMALEHNRSLQAARLDVEKAGDDLAAIRTRRLPSFDTTAQSSQLLSPVEFSFPQGAFGDYPGTGPIPATDTTITSPRKPNLMVSSQITQPLSQLFEIGMNIRGAKTNVVKGFGDLAIAMLTSMTMIFLALVFQFKHAIKPLIVGAAIPYGVVGALAALWIMGEGFGFMAFLGIASLIGVVVSHIIVLFDFIEERREHGEPLQQALLDAGVMRGTILLLRIALHIVEEPILPVAVEKVPPAVVDRNLLWRLHSVPRNRVHDDLFAII